MVKITFLDLDPQPGSFRNRSRVAGGGVADCGYATEVQAPRDLRPRRRVSILSNAPTRQTGDTVATTVVMGAPPVFASTRWSMAIGTDLAVDNVLVVLNATGSDGTVTVKTLGAGGEVPVPGMESIPLPASAVITIGVSDPTALGHPLIVESTQRMFVERLLPRDPDLRGRSGSYALPG
jgi:hypothetical protein